MKMAVVLFTALVFSINLSHAAGNAEAGKARALAGKDKERCADCHGPDGNKPDAADRPILAGQHYDYLVKALRDYQNGRRVNATMKTYAGPLSRKDIEDLAAWFSSQKSTSLHDQR